MTALRHLLLGTLASCVHASKTPTPRVVAQHAQACVETHGHQELNGVRYTRSRYDGTGTTVVLMDPTSGDTLYRQIISD